MRYQEKQVVVLGGGCGALWLLHELSSGNYPALLIDHSDLGHYASTRNQSWLHSGALYAVIIGQNEAESEANALRGTGPNEGLDRTAQECLKAFGELQDFCPEAFEKDSECLFLFGKEREARRAFEKMETLGVRAEVVARGEVEEREPVLSPAAALPFGLITQDIPFDSSRILTRLAEAALAYGGEFHRSSTDLRGLNVSFHNNLWRIRDGGLTVVSPIVVCAAGALIPAMFQHISRRRSDLHAWTIQKCLVGVLHHRICNRIVALRSRQAAYMNLVPFEGGTTVNLGDTDKIAGGADDADFPVSAYGELAGVLNDFVPGIKKNLACEAHFYVCQKLRNLDKSSHPWRKYGARHYFWIEGDENFFYFYPGKFTLAHRGARALIEFLVKTGKPEQSNSASLFRADPPTVARRPYYAPATHVTKVSDAGELRFEEKR